MDNMMEIVKKAAYDCWFAWLPNWRLNRLG